jgi:protein-disulfide isomerase/uncharacterized membrane protein
MKSVILQLLALVLAVAAGFLSYELLAKHLTGSTSIALLDSACEGGDVEQQSSTSCDEVLKSKYGVWPFVKEGDDENVRRVPVALGGLFYYSVLVVWLIGVGVPSWGRRWIHIVPLGINLGGLLVAGFFTYVMFSGMDYRCPLCLVTHVLNLLVFICLLLMWPRRPLAELATGAPALAASPASRPNPLQPSFEEDEREALLPASTDAGRSEVAAPVVSVEAISTAHAEQSDSAEALDPATAAQEADPLSNRRGRTGRPLVPTGRQVLITLVAMWLVWFGESMFYLAAENRSKADNLDRCLAEIASFKGNPEALVKDWERSHRYVFKPREDDAVRGGIEGEQDVQCVVFSDFGCPWCRKLAEILEKQAAPLFGGHLKFIFRHFPLDSDCNEHVKYKTHPQACYAARLAEAARIQAGRRKEGEEDLTDKDLIERSSKAFWRAHDFLFAGQKYLKKDMITTEVFARVMGLDEDQLKEDMHSEEVNQRIKEDTDLARSIGLKSTPVVYLSNHRVSKIAIPEMDFWDLVADRFWEAIKKPRPEETLLKNVKAALAKGRERKRQAREEAQKSQPKAADKGQQPLPRTSESDAVQNEAGRAPAAQTTPGSQGR